MWTHCAHAWLQPLFIYLIWNGLQWGLCFLACLLQADIFHNLSWFMVWKRFFQWDSETACFGRMSCNYPVQMKPSSPAKALFFFCSVLCSVTGQSLQGRGGHRVLTSVFIRGLEVLSDQTFSSSIPICPFLINSYIRRHSLAVSTQSCLT